MEPNTNPLGNPGPASGVPSGFPPSNNPPQGISTPAGAIPVTPTSASQPQVLDTTSMPSASNVSNASIGVGDSFGSAVLPGTDSALTGGNGAFTAPETAPVEMTQVGMSNIAAPISPSNDPINTAFAKPAPGSLRNDAALPPSPSNEVGAAAPIGHPTNIDGINQVRVPDVPGGQAMSSQPNAFVGPNDHQTPSVSFNDPAIEPGTPLGAPVVAQAPQPQKKKSNKTVLIILSVIAFIVAVGLAVVLVMEVTGTGFFATNNNGGSDKEKIEPQSGNGGSEIVNPGADGTGGANGVGGDGNGTGGNDSTGNGNGNGTGGGSGSGNTPSGQTSDSVISCDTTTMGVYDGTTAVANITFTIVDNKINDITTSVTMTDAEGHEQSQTQTYTFEEMIGMSTFDEQNGLVASDGTLLVSPEYLADYMETNMIDGESTITCTVR